MKTAVISGGAGGLGRALGAALRAEGWRVVAIDRDVSALVPDETLIALQCDLTDHAARDAVLAQLAQDYPPRRPGDLQCGPSPRSARSTR